MNWNEFQAKRQTLFKTNYARAPIYAKAVTHKLTPFVVFVFYQLKLTPNTVTALSLFVGAAACLCFALTSPVMMLCGALLLELYYVFDSVDGQLARLTGKLSKSGAFFDVLGNYLIHPWIFVAIGWGQYRLSGDALPVLCGASAAFSYLWLGVIWDVRSNVILSSLKKKGGFSLKSAEAEATGPTGGSLPKVIFSTLHKVSTYPTVMNVITLIAVLSVALDQPTLYSKMLLVYAVLIPVISLAKMAKMIRSGEVDQEFNSLAP